VSLLLDALPSDRNKGALMEKNENKKGDLGFSSKDLSPSSMKRSRGEEFCLLLATEGESRRQKGLRENELIHSPNTETP